MPAWVAHSEPMQLLEAIVAVATVKAGDRLGTVHRQKYKLETREPVSRR